MLFLRSRTANTVSPSVFYSARERLFVSGFRRNSLSTKAIPSASATGIQASPPVSYPYPPKLLFYYAGRRMVYLGTLKLYSALLASYSVLLVAPNTDALALSKHDLFPSVLTPHAWLLIPTAFAVAGCLPLLFLQFLTYIYPSRTSF
jgi:hypothetical protein